MLLFYVNTNLTIYGLFGNYSEQLRYASVIECKYNWSLGYYNGYMIIPFVINSSIPE